MGYAMIGMLMVVPDLRKVTAEIGVAIAPARVAGKSHYRRAAPPSGI